MVKLKCIKYIRDRIEHPVHGKIGLKEAKEFVEGMFEYAGGGNVYSQEDLDRITAEVRYESRSKGFSEGYVAGWEDGGNE